MYIRNLLVVCNILIVGFLAATPAVADGYGYAKRPLSVQENPRTPFQVEPPPVVGNDQVIVEFLAEVPQGKRLIMQHVSLRLRNDAQFAANASCVLFVTEIGVEPVGLRLPVITQRQVFEDLHVAEGPITMYAEAGRKVFAACVSEDSAGGGVEGTGMIGTLVGYFVDVRNHHSSYWDD